MVKTWIPHYLLVQEEFENLCFVAVLMKEQKLWPFVHMMLKRSFAIDLSSWISSLFVVKQDSRGNNLPKKIYSLVHGIPVQIDPLAAATLWGCNSKSF